jgi:hypothetical protein
MINADKLGKRAATRSDAEFAAEEARLLDELLASADLSSPTVPEIRSGDQTSDTEASHDQVTWHAPAPAPEQPEEQAETVSPSAYSAPESAGPTPTDAPTMISDDELREPEELHQAWTLGDTEPVDEETKPVDEPPASPELGLPTVPALLPGDQTTDAVPSQDRGFWQAPVPAPEQPEQEAVTESPSAYSAPESAVPLVTDTATTINDDELRELEELHRTWTLGDAELDAEEAKPVDEPPAPAELSSAAALEALPGDQTTDAETPQDLGTIQAPVPAPEQPVEQAATLSPSAYGAPESAVPTHTTSATISADKPAKPDIPHRVWNFRDIAAVAEEAKPVHEPSSSVELSSAAALEALPGDQTTDAETPQDLGTSQAPVPVPDQPVEQAVTASPSAHIALTLAVPTQTASATVNVDRPGKLDARYRPWTLSAADLVAEEDSTDATTVDAARPGSLDARYRPWTLSAAELVAEEEKPVDEAPRPVVTTSPSAYSSPTSAGPASADTTTMGTADKPAKLDARYQRWTLRDTKRVAEQAKPIDEPAASVDLSSDTTPEARSADQTSDAEAVRGQATRQADLLPGPPQPAEPGVTVSPPTSSAPKSASTAPGDTTAMVTADKPAELGARYRPWTLRDTKPVAEQAKPVDEQAKPVAEQAKPVDEPAASADLTSDTTPAVRSDEQASDAETPHDQVTSPAEPAPAPEEPEEQVVTAPPSSYSAPTSVPTFTNVTTILGETKKSRRLLRVSPTVVGVLALVFLLAALGTGFVALRQNSSAGQWRQHDQNAVALNHALSTRNDVLSRDLASARAAVTSLNSQTSVLSGQVKSLQIKLSSTASANGRALARTALLTQLTKEAGTVSSELSMCVGEVSSLQTEIANDLSNLSHKDPLLQSNTRTASQVCASAQLGNQQLQTTLRGAG